MSVPVDPIAIASSLPPTQGEAQKVLLSLDSAGALRTVSRPVPHRGRYRIGQGTGAYAGLAAGSELFQMRWGDPNMIALIWQVSVSVIITVAANAAGAVDRQLVIARNWIASGSGGTAVTLNTGAGRLRSTFPPSLVTDMRYTSNAALGTGTKTNDGAGIGVITGSALTGAITTETTAVMIAKGDLFNALQGPSAHPLVLGKNEGIVVLMPTAEPSGATLMTYVDVEWSEVVAY